MENKLINKENIEYVVDSIPDGILVLNSSGVAKYANKSAITLFGGDPSFIINQELGLPLDQKSTSDLDIITNPHSPKIAEMRIQKMNLNGEEAYVASLRDVTLKRREQELIESVFNAFGAMNEGFFICDSEGKIFFANEAFERITGYKRSQVIGRNPNFLRSGVHTDEFYDNFYGKLKEEGEWQGIIWNKRFNGEIYPENMTVTTLMKDGRIDNYIAVFSDFTEGYKFHEELNRLKQEAIQSNHKKAKFISQASYEIRTPISEILGYTELVAVSPLTMEQKEYIEVIRSSSKSLINIVNDILEVSKIESGMSYSHFSIFSIKELIQEIYQFFRVHTVRKDLVLGNYFTGKIPDWVKGEKELLRQILTNLISNAIKYTPSGKIQFGIDSIEEVNETFIIQFSVIDTGIGIDMNQSEKIFNPFYKIENSINEMNSSDGNSAGLGLTIVSNILEQNGGSIKVESKLNKGSKFTFTYKVSKVDLKDKNSEFHKVSQNRLEKWKNTGRSLNILIVEDNLANQFYIKRILEKKAIQGTIARNGKEALIKLENKVYDAILMDINMPVMNGYETTELIRTSENPKIKNIPILGLTGLTSKEDLDKCKAVGMNSVINKPVEVDYLIFEILRFVFP